MISRNYKEYQDWRDQVISNFDNKCHWCGSTENLCAHHEIPYTGTTPETDLDTDNGICLCRSCHMKLHSEKESNPFYGKTHSEESKQKMSKSHSGKILSGEHKQKISSNNGKGMLGKTHTEETKLKISKIHKGKHLSKESKAKANYSRKITRLNKIIKKFHEV